MDPTVIPIVAATPMDQFVQAISGLLMLVATIAIGIVGDKLRSYLKAKVNEKAREVVLPALTKAIEYVHKNVEGGTVPTRDEVVTGAVDYMFAHTADSLKKLGLDWESVRQMVLARLTKENHPTPEASSPSAVVNIKNL